MRGALLAERDGVLQRVTTVALARSSLRTVVARFSQSAIGRPGGCAVRGRGDAARLREPRVRGHRAERARGRHADTAHELIGTRSAPLRGETRPIRTVFPCP